MPDIEIPDHWNWKRLDEIGEWNTGGTPRRSTEEYWEDGTIPWVTPKEMKRTRIATTEDNMTELGLEESTAKLVPEGTVLFVTRSGILEHSLPVAIAEADLTVNQDMKTLTTYDDVDPEFILFYSMAFEVDILQDCTKDGTTVASIDSDSLYSYNVPIPPIEEQRQIVQRVDELLSKLETGIDDLEKTTQKVQNYRASLLESAFKGNLTSDWRNKHNSSLQSPKEIFDKVSEDPERKSPVVEDIDELPNNWVWASFGDIFNVSIGSTPSRSEPDYWNGEIPWVSSGEVEFCRIKDTEEKITEEGLANSSTSVHDEGTVLLGIIGQGKTRGQAAILDVKAAHNQNTAAIDLSETDVPPEYVYYFLMGNYQRTRMLGSGNQQKALNKERVQKMQFPVPPIEEQQEIVERLEQRLSVIDVVLKEVENGMSRANTLRESILRQAVKGNLIEKDGSETEVIQVSNESGDVSGEQTTLMESVKEAKNHGE